MHRYVCIIVFQWYFIAMLCSFCTLHPAFYICHLLLLPLWVFTSLKLVHNVATAINKQPAEKEIAGTKKLPC